MVYPKKTWITNEVITTAALNNIENGLETTSVVSGLDIDANKDWNGKRISNVHIRANSVDCDSLNPNRTIAASENWVKEVGGGTVTVPSRCLSGTVTVGVHVSGSRGETGAGTYSATIYRNGVAACTISYYCKDGSYDFYEASSPIAVVAGDVLSVSGTDVKGFRVGCDTAKIAVVENIW